MKKREKALRARDITARPVVRIAPGAVAVLPVADEENRLVGHITEADALAGPGPRVRAVMPKPVVPVDLDADRLRGVLVTDRGELAAWWSSGTAHRLPAARPRRARLVRSLAPTAEHVAAAELSPRQ